MSRIEGPIDPRVIDKITQRACDSIALTIGNLDEAVTDGGGSMGDTPIERALLLAVWAEVLFGMSPLRDLKLANKFRERDAGSVPTVYCVVQHVVLDWPVDFLFHVSDFRDPKQILIVECDGHNFHERTAEQAMRDRSRDRRLQEAGYTVYRFTGSEIWRDPCSCADMIIDRLTNVFLDASEG